MLAAIALLVAFTLSSTADGNITDMDLASLITINQANAEGGCTESENYDPYHTPNGVECPGGGSYYCCP
ncbi:hypothetical protein [Maribacter sp. 2304DJ31-5]|uniref:hypothetical protein n=1 Tax=Maribacter sp. 2304DJ31-5 TaxID=3386273 RepID=UPI0039BCC6D6